MKSQRTGRFFRLSLALGLALALGCDFFTARPPTQASPSAATAPAAPPATPPTTPVVTTTAYLPVVTSSPSIIWRPPLDTTWQWQLTGLPIVTTIEAQMYDIDLFDNDARVVAELHALGRHVVCYVNAGAWENWRPDAGQFPPEVLGNPYQGWPGERWLDIRRIDVIGPIMRARFDQCRAKGFDALEPDNIDGYEADTGFPLTYQDQLTYNLWLAEEAHARGLSIAMKNDGGQIADLLPHYDWALLEDCFYQGWCEQFSPFVTAGKAVFAAEYTDTGITTAEFCPLANTLRFNAMLKHRDLDAWREACP